MTVTLELVELARSLIQFRTEIPPGNEEWCARYIHDFLADLHVEGAELRLDRFEAGRANIVAKFGPSEPGLLLGGHIDVVPCGGRVRLVLSSLRRRPEGRQAVWQRLC